MREGTGDGVDRWAKPLDTWLALFLNLRQGRHGPVIQDRPKTVYMPPDRASLPYLHNNPVRAGRPAEQSHPLWTSHAAYLGEHSPPRGLAIEMGLDLCGYSSSTDGREAFSRLVVARAAEQDEEWLSPPDAEVQRSRARHACGAPTEL